MKIHTKAGMEVKVNSVNIELKKDEIINLLKKLFEEDAAAIDIASNDYGSFEIKVKDRIVDEYDFLQMIFEQEVVGPIQWDIENEMLKCTLGL
jgi:hypothetical protein